MQVFNNLSEWQNLREELDSSKSIGFIPTMGNLHAGHAALIQQSIRENLHTLVSIFVNPTQFNRSEDLTHYPRTIPQDMQLLEELGVDFCLLPDYETLYTDGYRFRIEETCLSTRMEGPKRPGHFSGMLTIVLKLLMLIRPRRAYFGEKDYQQYQLVDGMVKAFFLPTSIIVHPTVREADLLPFSSRNTRLDARQRQKAGHFAQLFHQAQKSLFEIQQDLEKAGFILDYLEEYQGRRYIAVTLDTIRLIDNYACDCLKPVT